jgi:hypothetical protein
VNDAITNAVARSPLPIAVANASHVILPGSRNGGDSITHEIVPAYYHIITIIIIIMIMNNEWI